MNLALRLEEMAGTNPQAVALLDDERNITFRELDGMASRRAGGLRSLGVSKGDRVAIMAGSHAEFVATVLGIWKLGAITVAINAQLGREEVRHQLDNSEATVVVVDDGPTRQIIDSTVASLGRHVHVVDTLELDGPAVAAIDLPPGSDATIFYTSGTTGMPKGATHTHNSLAVQIDEVRAHFDIGPDDVFISVLPIYLLSLLILGPLTAICAGAPIRIMARYDASAFAKAVRADRTTVLGAIPLMFSDLLELPEDEAADVDLSSIRFAFCGGSPTPPEIRRAFEGKYGFRFVHAYGGTEGPSLVSTDPIDRDRKFDSVGVPLPHIRVTVVDDNDHDVETGIVGEVCTAAHTEGPHAGVYEPLRCYWGMPEATEEALRGGRFHWGDLGYLDNDGYLYIVDRKKDMIIRGGMNVYPKELEGLLYEDERIAECAVVGAPHRRYGEVPVAFIRTAPGGDITAEEAMGLVNSRTAKFKHLQAITFVEDFPRNSLGKILKRELRKTQ